MSLPEREAGVDASAPKTKGKTGKTADGNPKPLLKRQISPRKPHPYSLKAEHEQEEREAAVAAGRANEERRQAKRAAYWAAAKADDEPDPDEDDVDDADAEEIRSLYEDDDPDCHSHQAAADRPATSDLVVWSTGTVDQKERAQEFAREQVADYSSHELLLVQALLALQISKFQDALNDGCKDPTGVHATLKGLRSDKKWLEGWLRKNRPFAVAKGVRRQLCEDPLNGRAYLRGMDEWLAKKNASVHQPDDEAEEQPPTAKGAVIPKQSPAGGHGKHDVPAQFYSKEAKGRVVVIFEWTRELVNKRMRERQLTQQAHKGVSNLHAVLSQLLYWLTPKPGNKILAGGRNVIRKDGVWWVWLKPSRFKKGTGVSPQSVRSAVQRLEALGLVEGFQDKESGRTYVRPRAESFAKEVEAIVAAPGYGKK